MNRHLYKELYFTILPAMLMPTTALGMIIGISHNHNHNHNQEKKQTSMDILVNTIGYTSIGMITGFTFPISIPLIGSYILYRDIIKRE